jgi:hypothetical protein
MMPYMPYPRREHDLASLEIVRDDVVHRPFSDVTDDPPGHARCTQVHVTSCRYVSITFSSLHFSKTCPSRYQKRLLGAEGVFVPIFTNYLAVLFLSYCRHSRCGHTGARCRWLRGRESEGRSLGVRVSRLGGLDLGFGIAALISKKQRESKGVSNPESDRSTRSD